MTNPPHPPGGQRPGPPGRPGPYGQQRGPQRGQRPGQPGPHGQPPSGGFPAQQPGPYRGGRPGQPGPYGQPPSGGFPAQQPPPPGYPPPGRGRPPGSPGYGPPPGQGPPPGYRPPPGHGPPRGYGPPPGHGPPPGNRPPPGHGPPPGYRPPPGQGPPPGYGPPPGGPPGGYLEDDYPADEHFDGGYAGNEPPRRKRGMLAGVIVAIVLLAVAVTGFWQPGFLLSADDEETRQDTEQPAPAGDDKSEIRRIGKIVVDGLNAKDAAKVKPVSCKPEDEKQEQYDTFPDDLEVSIIGDPKISGNTATLPLKLAQKAGSRNAKLSLRQSGGTWCAVNLK